MPEGCEFELSKSVQLANKTYIDCVRGHIPLSTICWFA